MKHEDGNRTFWLVLIPSWVLGLYLLWAYIHAAGCPPAPPTSAADLFLPLLVVFLLYAPFASKISIGKLLSIERELKRTRDDVENFKSDTRQHVATLTSVATAARSTSALYANFGSWAQGQQDTVTVPQPTDRKKSAMELKILHTLWNKQINKFASLLPRFTFRINAVSPEFLEFREAGNRLIGQGLISETDEGQFFLTDAGLRYCGDHASEFSEDMWFEGKPIDPQKLQVVLSLLKK